MRQDQAAWIHMALWKPAQACCICLRSLHSVKGKRIVQSPQTAVELRGPGRADESRPAYPVDEGYVVQVRGAAWTQETIARAVGIAHNEHAPWMCQPCSGLACPDCGAPSQRPLNCEIMDEEGELSSMPALRVAAGCIVEGCSQHLPRRGRGSR